MRDFNESLRRGRLGEEHVVAWLQSCGWGVVPSYAFSGAGGLKAPRLLFKSRSLVIPDVDACRDGRRRWVEIKTYHHAHRNRWLGETVHGFERRLRSDYLSVERDSGTPVWLYVLEVSTGALLAAQLSQLHPHACQCGPCRGADGGACRAHIEDGVYFRRSEFALATTFDDFDMHEIRSAWPTPPSAQEAGAA